MSAFAPNDRTAMEDSTLAPSEACIMVVDDQQTNIQMIGSILGRLGYEIIPAHSGPVALKRVATRQPDLILLDLLMPGMGGYEVCQQLKQNAPWKDIPVIFLSAADDKELVVRALNVGGVDYITKPFNHAELVSRVQTQLTLKITRDRLKQLAEDKDELTGILTHDLKNYLGGIHMSAELLSHTAKRLNHERLAQLSDNILRSSAVALAFVKEFLANAAADHGLKMNLTEMDFGDIAANVLRQYQEAASRKDLEIISHFPPEPVMVMTDALALDQVLDNLISNAIKFSPHNKKITVTVQDGDRFAQCTVADEGPGFTAEDKQRMFKRYGRLSARSTGGEPSTGLGLSIALKLTQEMKGELICDSVHGSGAAFTVRLPKPKV